jgi:hypothetical protein
MTPRVGQLLDELRALAHRFDRAGLEASAPPEKRQFVSDVATLLRAVGRSGDFLEDHVGGPAFAETITLGIARRER